MSRPIDLAGFEAVFDADADPWRTYRKRDEAVKRDAILRALPPGRTARVLELGSGNGSNSAALARRAGRLDACEGTETGTALTAAALADFPHARAVRLVWPARLPRARYEAVVIAELLYYLAPRDMARLARAIAGVLAPGGRLVLAHHHVDFNDARQSGKAIHRRFLAASNRVWRLRQARRNRYWRCEALVLDPVSVPAIIRACPNVRPTEARIAGRR